MPIPEQPRIGFSNPTILSLIGVEKAVGCFGDSPTAVPHGLLITKQHVGETLAHLRRIVGPTRQRHGNPVPEQFQVGGFIPTTRTKLPEIFNTQLLQIHLQNTPASRFRNAPGNGTIHQGHKT